MMHKLFVCWAFCCKY